MWLTMPKGGGGGGQDEDVDLGVSEEPEQVLEQDRVAATGRIEEGRAEICGPSEAMVMPPARTGQRQEQEGRP